VRRFLIGWTTALAALGISTGALAVALWLMRFPIAAFILGAALAERGAEADFEIVYLDFGRIELRDLRIGAAAEPDASAESIEARWRWSGLTPRLESVRLIAPNLRARLTPQGRVSLGALDRVRSPPGVRRPSLPAMTLVIEDGRAVIAAPFGDLHAVFAGSGRLGADFSAVGRIPATSYRGDLHALENGAAELVVQSRDDAISFRLDATANALTWAGARANNASLRIVGRSPLDLARYDVDAAWRVGAFRGGDISADALSGALHAQAVAQETRLTPETWQGRLRVDAGALTVLSNTFADLQLAGVVNANGEQTQAQWTLAARNFDGLSLISERPSARGAMTFAANGALRGQAQLSLAQSRLNAGAQQRIREAFPNLGQTPVGPTFARAEAALDAAADRFDLNIPLQIAGEGEQVRLFVPTAAEARSSTGAQLRLSPLRRDAPALVLQWPGPALHGAVALELSGGGAPDAALLLDTVDWAQAAPFEAEGTLTLANWRADNASITADELAISIAVAPGGAGRIDVRGPMRISGPIGEGEVRDLIPALDIAILWRPGWRVMSNRGCLPTQMGGLDVAGLSFSAGAFALCPLEGPLISADASQRLSGGFVVRDLALSGRMAGEAAQPARLSSASVVGRFGGRTGDMLLALEAETPRLTIAMAEDRTLALTLQRLSANAYIADSWRVAGAFESGTLSDPALPGSVSTIAGVWSAAPEDGAPVIRVASAEALVTAHEPASEQERALFQPMRLANINAILRRGHVDANGDIVLESQLRQLAGFSAWHDIDDGVGAARVTAPSITFSETLQPYQITETARGVVENVRGPASAVADISWSRRHIDARGVVSLHGVSFATTTLPIVEDVRGAVAFDDLFALTTPPGQQVSIGLINPGVAVRNGLLRFQLLPEQRIAIEHAAFDFAGGELAMQPATIRLGEEQTSIVLTFSDIDAERLIATLGIPDLSASGRLEGAFPLLLTARTAFVEDGVLRALPGGGTLSYTGDAGQTATGVTRIAFDALSGFRYDELTLTLNGDISGDVLTTIEFTGQNTGQAVDLGPIAPVPGLGRVTVRGVPFDFNVRITAPFRRLAQTAASLVNPGELLRPAEEGTQVEIEVDVENAPRVDAAPPGTR
jgi:translocation and assembly module TamB